MTGKAMPLFEARGVAKSFGPQTVLKNFNLRIEPGEFVSLLGPSGCGKSTVLRLIAGLETATAGELGWSSEGRKYRSMVFQEANLLSWRTALENVRLPLDIQGALPDAALKWLKDLGLAQSLGKFPHELSGGMKMRVAIARALVTSPRLLLMDEPFAALDESTRFHLQEKTRQLFESSAVMSVVFVTHSLSEALFLSDRIVFFNADGGIHAEESIQFNEPRQSPLRLSQAYFDQLRRLQGVLSHLGSGYV